jgi:ABC-type lipoprotein release transport system permease subunit
MQSSKLTRLIGQNIRRNFSHFSMSAIGIVVGIASLSFFVGLRNGVKVWIHSADILPLNKMEVIPPKSDINISPEKLNRALDDSVVSKIRSRPEVVAAYPKMRFAFPGLARGGKSVFGQDIQIEFIGDGIDPDLVADEEYKKPLEFRDYWDVENPRTLCQVDNECPQGRTCNPATSACTECDDDASCGAGKFCEPRSRICLPVLRCFPDDTFVRNQDGTEAKDASGIRLRKTTKHDDCWQVSGRFTCEVEKRRCTNHCTADDQCGRYYYCDTHGTKTCYRAVPALVSRYLIEMYNGNIAPGRNWPKIDDYFASQFFGLVITAAVGDSVIGTGRKKTRVQKVQLVGISRKAIPLGVTVPLGYVKRWNKAFALRDETTKQVLPEEQFKYQTYSSVVVWLRSKDDVSSFAHFSKQLGFEQSDSSAEMVGNFIDFVGLLLSIVSVVILIISALNIAHTYYMIITERRREIGIMRALGANRWDIRALFIGEAMVLGLAGGTLGLAIGRTLAYLVDFASRKFVAEFMFKPKTYFDFPWWVWVGAIGFALLFCFLGTIFPANRAAKMEPAEALSVQ